MKKLVTRMFKIGDVVRPIGSITRGMLKTLWIEDDEEGWVDDLLVELNQGDLLVTRSRMSVLDKLEYVMVMNWWLLAEWFELEVN